MIARVRVAGDESWYHHVIGTFSDRGFLTLCLPYTPWTVSVRMGTTQVLLAATPEDMTALLRDETAA